MKVTALRARARCQVCDSKLPPRTEAFWDEATRTAVCLTCARMTGLEETPAAPVPPPESVAPPVSAEASPPVPPQTVVPSAPAPAAPAASTHTTPVAPVPPSKPLLPAPGPIPDAATSAADAPLTFDAPATGPKPVRRPRLTTPVRTRPPLQSSREPRPPQPAVEDRQPPLVADSQPPLPPRRPAAPVLPPRNPAAPDVDEPTADPVVGNEPDVDDEPQWNDPPAPSFLASRHEDQSRHVRASAGLIGRLRNVGQDQGAGALVDGDVLVDDLPLNDGVERGDPGDSVVGRALESARESGIEVLHQLAVGHDERIDHLVVAVNGLWVIRSEAVLAGPLERRDLGDWFTADPRLYVGDDDRSDLVNDVRDRAGTLRRFLASTSFADIPVRPVVTFGEVPAGWVSDPFSLAGVSVTWGSMLVEPMLDPVMVDKVTRAQLVQLLVDTARLH